MIFLDDFKNKRERARNAKLIIGMKGPTTTIFDPENPDDVRDFTFDYSYWSHDGSKELEDGYFAPDGAGSKYIGQVSKFTIFTVRSARRELPWVQDSITISFRESLVPRVVDTKQFAFNSYLLNSAGRVSQKMVSQG